MGKKILLGLGLLVGLLFLIIVVGPFLIPVEELDGLAPRTTFATTESQFVTVDFPGTDGLEFHYEETANADTPERTFILLHGFTGNLYTWDKVRDFLATQGRVIAYDRIPFGLSAKPLEADWTGASPYTDEATVTQLTSLMDAWGVEEAILVGNSAGGTVAMQLALTHPERVAGLILLDPAVYSGGGSPLGDLAFLPQVDRLGPLISRSFATNDNILAQSYNDPSTITDEGKALARIWTQMENWDKALWAFTKSSTEGTIDLVPRLSELTVPTLVVAGDNDQIVPTAEHVRLGEELPRATTEILPNCGHVPQDECPEATIDALQGWLAAQE